MLLDRLLGHVWGALARSGDDQAINALLGGLDQRGTSADHQRALRASGPPPGGLARSLAWATLADCAAPVGR
jgi:hypothetical protein